MDLDHARALWSELAGVPVEFTSPTAVVTAPGSRLCPPGWAGIVRIGDAAVVTAPDARGAEALRAAVRELASAELVDPVRLGLALSGRGAPVLDVLGPATLSYLDRDAFVPALPEEAGTTVERASPGDPALTALLAGAGKGDADESGLDEITSPAFLLREAAGGSAAEDGDGAGNRPGDVVAAAGYVTWPRSVAHVCVLVAPHRRGRRLAGIVASAAVSHALDAGLLPQWRARPYPSRRVATALGFRELGAQLSVRI
ncbi:GNAT family N-acetyltransferase [Streptomyces sp. IB2014 016-6]|uniref:GNAT family N-acetyltransferase n=1 Tax=Streptomyces sp. IB2014 016-6 TaxID=2517818 RepID=UPI0011C88347|nr:GNAT family N-acetyltransferase [Streptomyces sp. IB2014 016-6]TXL87184.1 GNAT family N-acetyltransferase [Streptomyces sp. IB2014 016-6]